MNDARNAERLPSDYEGWTDAQIDALLDRVIAEFFEVVGQNESGETLYRRKLRRS